MQAGHHSAMAGASPWDRRLEYIHSVDKGNWFTFSYPLAEAGTAETVSVVIAFDSYQSGDKKLFGPPRALHVGCYGGKWRNSGFHAWKMEPVMSRDHIKIRWTLSYPGNAVASDPDTGEVLFTHSGISSVSDDCNDKYTPPQAGLYSTYESLDSFAVRPLYLWVSFGGLTDYSYVEGVNLPLCSNSFGLVETPPPSVTRTTYPQDFTPHKIYDFYRIVNGRTTAHLVPCEIGGVVGMYDEVGKRFYYSVDPQHQFEAGPQVGDKEGYSAP